MSDRITGLYLTDDECHIVRISLKLAYTVACNAGDLLRAEQVRRIASRVPDKDATWRPGEHSE